LDLLKRCTTLFAVRYLFNGGIDKHFPFTNHTLMNLPHQFKRLMDDWFIIEKSFDPEDISK
ncbi:5475_t:CDS:1, partial [Racocetra fulgida]